MLELYIDDYRHSFKTIEFSGGEAQVKIDPVDGQNWEGPKMSRVRIMAHLRKAFDVMELLMLTDAIRRLKSSVPITLQMPYVPYARQDRVCAEGEALSIKVFADLINSQNYAEVIVWDPHSDVAPALLNNCTIVKAYRILDRAFALDRKLQRHNVVLVSPDAGANKKVHEASQFLRIKDVIRADKTRDPETGQITGTVVYSEHVGDKDFLILDDICDGGRTFLELGKVLRPLTNGKIYLYVTHGIFSSGFTYLRNQIDHIYTANSFVQLGAVKDFVTEISL
jgi:ribose-phosphate pyrophosphokinase